MIRFYMAGMVDKVKQNLHLIILFLFTIGVFAITARINIFRYNNFDFGKFDLGNMAQMAWYTLQGKPMYLTDYFGSNLPRWSMSHVDPILLVFVPLFALYQHSLTLVFIQVVLVLAGAFIIYKIAFLVLESKLSATFFAFAYLFYPSVGFLNAWTGYHGVTVVIPFFLMAFYLYEKMYKTRNFTKKGLFWFWVFLILTMMGKEQLPLYIMFYGLFILIFRFAQAVPFPVKGNMLNWVKNLWNYQNVRTGTAMILVGFVWFFIAFFVIIPAYADERVQSFRKFAEVIEINPETVTNVENPNYFLSRYSAFGESYTEVLLGMLFNPDEVARISLGDDKPKNLRQTLEPMLYTSVLHPPLFLIAFPDFLINYATSQGGIGTSEIINHRISMIVPVLFISSIYSVSWLSKCGGRLLRKWPKFTGTKAAIILSLIILSMNVYTSYTYNNPVYLWLIQAVQKRVAILPVFAKVETEIGLKEDIYIGERFRLTKLDTKDRECANKIIQMIPQNASISGPDYLGAHLALRETYAIFPTLYTTAEYVIVDVFSQKILRILDLDVTLVRDVTSDVIKSDDYKLRLGCGNLFVFENIGSHNKSELLPLQEKFDYAEKVDLEIFESLTVVDYSLPKQANRGENLNLRFTYVKREETRLDQYVLFLTFINDQTGEVYQVANLPSFALNQVQNWAEDRYYIEDLEVVFPEFLESGNYRAFIGMSNEIRTRSIYLGDLLLE